MNGRSCAFVFACGALIAATPSIAQATGGESHSAASASPRTHAGGRFSHRLNAQMDRTAPDGCAVSSTLRGTIQGWQRSSPSALDESYSPDLRVSTNVSCPDGSRNSSVGRVKGVGFSEADLGRAIEARGRAMVRHEAGTCSYSPEPRIANGTVFLQGVRQSCTVARGGGPKSM